MGTHGFRASVLFAVTLLMPLDLTRAAPIEWFREYVEVVDRAYQRLGLTVTVVDGAGRSVRGLRREDFRVFEDEEEVEVLDFGVEGERVDRPLSIAVLLDISESMDSQIKKVRSAAGALISKLRPHDEIMVAQFNHDRTVLQPFTRDPGLPKLRVEEIRDAWGGTALFRTIEQTLKDLRERQGRKIILAVTDGLDNFVMRDRNALQSTQVRDLLHLCLRTQTVVYGIRPGLTPGRSPFEQFVEQTGGGLLYTGKDLEDLFVRLSEEFLSQYYLGYDIDPNMKEGKRRRIRVEVSDPDLRVRTLAGYFTPRSQLETLLRDSRDEDVRMRTDAAYELGFFRDPRAVKALLRALEDDEEEVRLLATVSLSRLEAVEAIRPWIELLGVGSAQEREAAARALFLSGARAVPELSAALDKGGRGAKGRRRVFTVARILGRVGDERAFVPLVGTLKAGNRVSRAAAAEGLGELGLRRAVPPLTAALKDSSPMVRSAVLRSIVKLAGEASRPLIEGLLLGETDPEVRAAARRALESL